MVKDDAGEWQYVSDLGNPLGRFNALYHAHRFLTLSEDEALVLTRLENESEGLIYVKKAQEKGQAFALMGVLLLAHMLALMSTEDACKKKEEKCATRSGICISKCEAALVSVNRGILFIKTNEETM